MLKVIKIVLIFLLLVFYPTITHSAEILQINSSDNILVGDQNRNLSIQLFCIEINENDQQIAVDLLRKEFPRGTKIKIKSFGFKKDILLAKVFNLNETKEMTDLLISNNLSKDNCKQ